MPRETLMRFLFLEHSSLAFKLLLCDFNNKLTQLCVRFSDGPHYLEHARMRIKRISDSAGSLATKLFRLGLASFFWTNFDFEAFQL